MALGTTDIIKNAKHANTISINDEELKELQSVILDIMLDIDEFCKEEDINYALGGGSVLGAIRHQGFIPWDDDADLDMPRPDYDVFIKKFPQKYKSKYDVQCPELTPEIGLPMMRVRLKGTVLRNHDDYPTKNCGVFVDIAPIENVYDNKIRRNLHGIVCMWDGLMFSCRRFYRDRKFYIEFSKSNRKFKLITRMKILIGFFTSIHSVEYWSLRIARRYSKCKDNNTKYVSVPCGRGHYFDEMFLRSAFVPTRDELFEGHLFPVPVDAESYLEHHYGDWETPPSDGHEEHAYLEFKL